MIATAPTAATFVIAPVTVAVEISAVATVAVAAEPVAVVTALAKRPLAVAVVALAIVSAVPADAAVRWPLQVHSMTATGAQLQPQQQREVAVHQTAVSLVAAVAVLIAAMRFAA